LIVRETSFVAPYTIYLGERQWTVASMRSRIFFPKMFFNFLLNILSIHFHIIGNVKGFLFERYEPCTGLRAKRLEPLACQDKIAVLIDGDNAESSLIGEVVLL
jgi:hypothetical protein